VKLIERLGVPDTPSVRVLLVALAIDATGTGLFAAFSLLYFHEVAGLPLARVGLTLTVANVVGLIANPLAGSLVDRFGARPILVSSFFLQAAGYAGYYWVDTVLALFLAAVPVTIGLRAFWVAFPSLVADLSTGGDRHRWYAVTGAAQYAGWGLGGLIAGAMVAIGGDGAYKALLVANGISFLFAGALVTQAPAPARAPSRETEGGGYRAVLADRGYMGITIANIVFSLCAMMIVFLLPIYAIERLDAPAWIIGVLFALNTALLALAQPLIVVRLRRFRRTRALAGAGVTWAVSFLVFLGALALPDTLLVPYLILATALYTAGELVYVPVAAAVAAAAGPEALRGRYIATYSLAWGIAATTAPAFVTASFALGAGVPWFLATTLALGAAALVVWVEPLLAPDAVHVAESAPSEVGGIAQESPAD
jgi:MFS family permease